MNSTVMSKRVPTIMAWIAMLVVSDLPDIIITFAGSSIPGWIFWAKAGFLALFLILTFFWRSIRSLWQYSLILLTLFLFLGMNSLVRGTAFFRENFNYTGVSFFTGYAAVMTLDILVALAIIVVLWLMKGDRKSFFLVRGKMDAPIEPVRWLGIKPGESWKVFGWIFAGVAAIVVLVPTILSISPSYKTILRALPLMPAAVLFAAVNAFTEETYFRASLISTLHDAIGKTHTLLISVVFFGLAHWLYGSPPGLIGFLMTGFLAWLLGKGMLETKGFLWPWFIHFMPDVVIFISYTLLFVQS
jgi:membrane protease YdiL (CAAX protease family)